MYTSLVDALKDLESKGYTYDFKLMDDSLECERNGKKYHPHNFEVVSYFRFEANTDPDDASALYVIETDDGLKGTLVTGYGIYVGPVSEHLLEKLNINNS